MPNYALKNGIHGSPSKKPENKVIKKNQGRNHRCMHLQDWLYIQGKDEIFPL
jgi:hypothetical protein